MLLIYSLYMYNVTIIADRRSLSVGFNSFKVLMVMYLYFVQSVCMNIKSILYIYHFWMCNATPSIV